MINAPFVSNNSQPLHPGGNEPLGLIAVCKGTRYKNKQKTCGILVSYYCVTNQPNTQWLKARVGKLWSMSQIQATACFWKTHKLRKFYIFRIFFLLKNMQQKTYVASKTQNVYSLAFYGQSLPDPSLKQ